MERCDSPKAIEQACAVMSIVLSAMLDYPEYLRVIPHHADTGVVLRVHCAPCEISKLIGKQGRTARALRTVLMAIAKQSSFHLDIVECPGEGHQEQPSPELYKTDLCSA